MCHSEEEKTPQILRLKISFWSVALIIVKIKLFLVFSSNFYLRDLSKPQWNRKWKWLFSLKYMENTFYHDIQKKAEIIPTHSEWLPSASLPDPPIMRSWYRCFGIPACNQTLARWPRTINLKWSANLVDTETLYSWIMTNLTTLVVFAIIFSRVCRNLQRNWIFLRSNFSRS